MVPICTFGSAQTSRLQSHSVKWGGIVCKEKDEKRNEIKLQPLALCIIFNLIEIQSLWCNGRFSPQPKSTVQPRLAKYNINDPFWRMQKNATAGLQHSIIHLALVTQIQLDQGTLIIAVPYICDAASATTMWSKAKRGGIFGCSRNAQHEVHSSAVCAFLKFNF